MIPVLPRCFWPIVILVSGYAYGSGVKTVDLSSAGQRSAPILAAGDLTGGAAENSNVEYVDDSLEPLYDFLIELRLHKLCKLLREAHLDDILLEKGLLTIFAPTDGSFVFLPGGTLEEIRRNPQWLRDFLLHHIVAGDLSSRKIQDELVVTSLQGSPLRFNIYGSEQVYTVSGSQILSFDLPFQLGRVHVIDHPLYPIPEGNIVGYLQPTHSYLYRLLLSTGLAEILSGGTYTIFAPDDKAFGYLSQDFLDTLNRNRTLAEKILLAHVVHGSIYTRGITNGMQLESAGGARLTFAQNRGLTFVNGVPVVSPDIPVTNGVVHIINRVLLPDDIDTDCQCKSSRGGAVSNVPRTPTGTTTNEVQRRGGSGQPQTPGTGLTRRPVGQTGEPETPDSPYRTRQPQIPGTSTSSGSDGRPGSPHRTQSSGRPSAGSPGQIPSGPFTGSQTQRPGSPQRGSGRPSLGQSPEDQIYPLDHGTQETPGDDLVPGQPRAPGSTFGTGQAQRPGSSVGTGQPQTPGSSFGTGQPHTPGSSFGGRQPQEPGSSFGTGQPQTPGGAFGTGSAQRPGSSFGAGQQQAPDGTFGPDSRQSPGSSLEAEQPQYPDTTFGTRPVQRPDGPFETDQQQTTGGAFGTQTGHRPGSSFGTGQPQTPGTGFGTGTAQRPGSSFGTGQPQTPVSGFGTGTAQRPGSPFGTGQPHTPGSTFDTGSQQRPGSSFGTGQSQVPGGTFGTGQDQRPGSHVTKGQAQRRGQGQRPQGSSSPRYPQGPGSGIRQPQRPGSGIKEPQRPESEADVRPGSATGESQRPGSGLPQRPGIPAGTGQTGRPGGISGQPQRPGTPVSTGQPGRPGSVVGQPQRPETVFETEYPVDESSEQQIPGSTFETDQPERVGSLTPDERPSDPGRTKINQPGRIPLPPPPTRSPVRSGTRTTRYPGSPQRETPSSGAPQDDGTQSGGYPGSSVRGPYRPTRAPSSSSSHSSRYPRPGTQSRVTPTRSPHVTSAYPDSQEDQFPDVSGQTLQPGRTDSRKQPSTRSPQTQPSRHRTPQPVSRTTRRPLPSTDRPSAGQARPIPTRAPVSRPGSRPVPETTNCRQPGDRITSSNRNLPLCSTQDVSQEPCQSLDSPYNPSDPRPVCPDTDRSPQGCRNALEPPGLNDRRPVCRIPQRRPSCRKFNEPRDGRPLCPGSARNCRLPEEPENPSNPLPVCQDVVSVEGCRRPDERYDPRDRRPECPPDDCRPPQEPLRPGDTRPLCTVNEEDSIRQPFVPTTSKPRYPQQPRPGSQPEGTPGSDQSRPGKQPSQGVTSVGSRPQTPSWQQPPTQPQSPRQPARTESVTTRRPGKQPQITPINPSELSPDDNDALIAPEEYPPGRPRYPVSSQDTRRQGQPSPVIDEPSLPQPVDREQPQVQDQDQPGRPHSTGQRPSGQPGLPQTIPQRPGSQGDYPHSTGQRPSGQPGLPQTTPQRPGSQSDYPHSVGQRPSGQPGLPQTTPQRPGSQGDYPHSTGQRPSGQPGVPQTTPQRPGSQGDYPHSTGQRPSGQPGLPQRPGSQGDYPHSTGQRPSGQPGLPQTTPQRPGSQGDYPHSAGRRPSGQSGLPQTAPQRPGSQGEYPHSTGQRPLEQPDLPETTPQRPGSQSGYPPSTPQRPSPSGGSYPGRRPAGVPRQPPVGSQPSSSPGSSTGGDDSARSLLNIVRDPGLQIKGHPVKLTIVLDLFEKAGLVHILEGPGPATAFLPSDDAFKKLPRGVVEQLSENPELLRQVLLYHVVGREVRPSAQETSYTVPTLNGKSLVITMLKEGRLILIGGAKAVAVTRASNGIFYVINELLYPLPHEDIVSALKARPDLTQVTSLVQRSGLTQMLTGTNPFTLFAPTDAAFRDIPESTLKVITQNSTAIQELLLGHIVEGAHFGREFLAGGVFPNARGGKLRFKVLSYGYTVNDANIKTPEIITGTGVIHLVDQVLLEPEDFQSVQEQPQGIPIGGVNVVRVDVADNYENYPEIAELARGMGLNKFLSWITNTGLIERVHDGGSYTILAPTDAAVNTLPENMIHAIDTDPDQVRPLLKFHIITQHIDLNNIRNEQTAATLLPDKRIRFNVIRDGPDQIVTACGVPITQPQGSGTVRLVPVSQPLYPPSGSLAQVLEASPILQNLAKSIRTFHLTWMFTGQGPTTIFAPSDAAFEALSDEDRKNLIENRQAFTELLKRHIVKGSIFTSGIQDGMQVRNDNRETLTFSVHPGGISVNSIPISYGDVTATNGVLHVIDHFL